MDKFFRELNQKGPGGIPKWIYAAGAVIILYLAYRWYSNRSASSSSSSSSPDTSGADTSSDTTSTDASTDPGTDTGIPDETDTTAPTPDDTSPVLESQPPQLIKAVKALQKKRHVSVHDKKQGTHGTARKAVHKASTNHKQHPKSHAPKKKGVKHSGEKATATSGIPASRPQAFASVHSTSTPVAIKKVSKANPAPIAAPAAAKRVEAKHPVKKK